MSNDKMKKELKDLGDKYDVVKAELVEVKERLESSPKDKQVYAMVEKLEKRQEELTVKIEELNYTTSGMVYVDGKWVKPKKEEPEPPKKPKPEPPKESELKPKEKTSGWFL